MNRPENKVPDNIKPKSQKRHTHQTIVHRLDIGVIAYATALKSQTLSWENEKETKTNKTL